MCESVSSVPPDLEETMKNVFSRSSARSVARTKPGSVESSTCSSRPPGTVAERAPDHLGAEARAAHAEQHGVLEAVRRAPGGEGVELATRARASCPRSSASPGGWRSPASPGPPQSVSSLCQMRLATSSRWACSMRSTIVGSSSSGIADSIVSGRPVTMPSRASSTPPISSSKGVDELLDALAQQRRRSRRPCRCRRRRALCRSSLGSSSARRAANSSSLGAGASACSSASC